MLINWKIDLIELIVDSKEDVDVWVPLFIRVYLQTSVCVSVIHCATNMGELFFSQCLDGPSFFFS